MNVLERQYGIMSDLDMGEGREFVNYKLNAAFPHGGVCYNWDAAGDLKTYSGTVAQWTAIQVAMNEIITNKTVIIATYLEANDETVRLRINDDGELYFIGPDGSINTITAAGMETEEAGGGAAKHVLSGMLGADQDAKYNDCSKKAVEPGGVNYNWADAGNLKDYDGTTWAALAAAKDDILNNGTTYLATYDDTTLVELQVDEDTGDVFYITNDGTQVTLRDPNALAANQETNDISDYKAIFQRIIKERK